MEEYRMYQVASGCEDSAFDLCVTVVLQSIDDKVL